MKITEKNRSLVFFAATMIIGVLIIGVILISESKDVTGGILVDEQAGTNFKILEQKIDSLEKQNFNPNSYNNLATEINTSLQQELITTTAKSNLLLKLSATYSNLVYKQCDIFLAGNYDNSQDLLSWLSQLERINSRNSTIDKFRNQIKLYGYYSSGLPNKINAFIDPGISNYDDQKYRSLKAEVQTMPGFDQSYKNSDKFNNIRNNLTIKLEDFNALFYSTKN